MIIDKIDRPPLEIVEGFKDLLRDDSITCAISDCMGRLNAMTSDVKPLFDGIRFAGPAVTVKTLASDLAAPCKAIDVCRPGDVLVIDCRRSEDTAFWGENMTLSALHRGVAAVVIDGACRDVEEIRKLKFPVICRGIVPNVGSISGYGDVNVLIQCSGVAVAPGDIVVADGNGVVVVPRGESESILEKTRRLLETERLLQARIKAGATIGELIDIDEIFRTSFSYQQRATENPRASSD